MHYVIITWFQQIRKVFCLKIANMTRYCSQNKLLLLFSIIIIIVVIIILLLLLLQLLQQLQNKNNK